MPKYTIPSIHANILNSRKKKIMISIENIANPLNLFDFNYIQIKHSNTYHRKR
jgi:hypothetical protein